MRIIAGKYRGKKLLSPLADAVRPTADRARESVFNILNGMVDDWAEIRLLDVFCGTGAFGLEALSRGAVEICLLDIDTATADKNAKLFGAEKDKIKVVRADVRRIVSVCHHINNVLPCTPHQNSKVGKADKSSCPYSLRSMNTYGSSSASGLLSPTIVPPARGEAKGIFNMVFLDAPYNAGLSDVAWQNLNTGGWVADGALVIVEVEKNEKIDLEKFCDLTLLQERVYGLAKFLFFRYNQFR